MDPFLMADDPKNDVASLPTGIMMMMERICHHAAMASPPLIGLPTWIVHMMGSECRNHHSTIYGLTERTLHFFLKGYLSSITAQSYFLLLISFDIV